MEPPIFNGISLLNYEPNEGGTIKLREDFFTVTGTYLFECWNWYDLSFNMLSKTKELMDVSIDMGSLEAASTQLLSHFNIQPEDYQMFHSGEHILSNLKETPALRLFIVFILHLEHLPAEAHSLLKSKVQEHLVGISSLIDWYESDPYIQSYLKDVQKPRNHEDGIRYDFYQRCVAVQKEILKHFLHGIKLRAVQKSTARLLDMGVSFSLTERYRDYPYKYGHPFTEGYYDYRIIDHVGHRLSDIGISKIP